MNCLLRSLYRARAYKQCGLLQGTGYGTEAWASCLVKISVRGITAFGVTKNGTR